MKRESARPKKIVHVVVGTPDEENCPICRAHSPRDGDRVDVGPLGPVLVQELELSRILRCPCPLCAQARRDVIEG